jgi:hypothetical protein
VIPKAIKRLLSPEKGLDLLRYFVCLLNLIGLIEVPVIA